MRIVLVGGVHSTVVALDSLLAAGGDVVGVLGYEPRAARNVSGWVNVADHARSSGIQHVLRFSNVNDIDTIHALQTLKPDILLVVGLSQMLSRAVRETARKMAIGFHPTKLPRGRGRAPIAWLVLKQEQGAASLFELADGADEGDILAQVPYEVRSDDHAGDVMGRCMDALEVAISRLMADLNRGELSRVPQAGSEATYWGARRPEDGRIDWRCSAAAVDALIRASAHPHPGAFTITQEGERIAFMKSFGVQSQYSGVPGRVLEVREEGWLVACGDSAVFVGEILRASKIGEAIRVGDLIATHTW